MTSHSNSEPQNIEQGMSNVEVSLRSSAAFLFDILRFAS